jgi:hypothetical protein
MGVIDPQTWADAEDGRALRELRESQAAEARIELDFDAGDDPPVMVRVGKVYAMGQTVAEAADACREALR